MIESCMIVSKIFVSFHINFLYKNVIILIIVMCTKCILRLF